MRRRKGEKCRGTREEVTDSKTEEREMDGERENKGSGTGESKER